jgi:uncharacterized membrane protein YheB (UPF0754 family)
VSDAAPDDPLGRIDRPAWADRVQRIQFLELFEKYRQRMVHHKTMLPFDPTESGETPLTIERLAFETGWGLRLALKVFFPTCAALFLLSFWWNPWGLIRSCSVAGMIGFGTNWVAIKMLFWPREPRPVFGQGLIPSQRDQLIQKVADEVLEKLINEELIAQKIGETRVVQRFSDGVIEKLRVVTQEEEFQGDLRNMVLTYVADITSNPDFRLQLTRKAESSLEEFAGSRFKGWLVKKLKDVWRTPLVDLINKEIAELDQTLDAGLAHMPGVLERLPEALEKRQEQIDHVLTTMLMGIVREVDVREIVLEQLSTVTTEQLEAGFREFSDDKLSFITLLGGLLGLVGGTVLIWPVPSILVLLGLGAAMTVVDVLVHPFMRSRYWPKKPRDRRDGGAGGGEPSPAGAGGEAQAEGEAGAASLESAAPAKRSTAGD